MKWTLRWVFSTFWLVEISNVSEYSVRHENMIFNLQKYSKITVCSRSFIWFLNKIEKKLIFKFSFFLSQKKGFCLNFSAVLTTIYPKRAIGFKIRQPPVMLDCSVVSWSFDKDLGVGFGDQNEELLHPNLNHMSSKKLVTITIKSFKNEMNTEVSFLNILARRNFERVRIFCTPWKYNFQASKILQTNCLHSKFHLIFEQDW